MPALTLVHDHRDGPRVRRHARRNLCIGAALIVIDEYGSSPKEIRLHTRCARVRTEINHSFEYEIDDTVWLETPSSSSHSWALDFSKVNWSTANSHRTGKELFGFVDPRAHST